MFALAAAAPFLLSGPGARSVLIAVGLAVSVVLAIISASWYQKQHRRLPPGALVATTALVNEDQLAECAATTEAVGRVRRRRYLVVTAPLGQWGGLLVLYPDSCTWAPDRFARLFDVGGFTLSLDAVIRVETGAVPGTVGLGCGLELVLEDGHISFIVAWIRPDEMEEALMQTSLGKR